MRCLLAALAAGAGSAGVGGEVVSSTCALQRHRELRSARPLIAEAEQEDSWRQINITSCSILSEFRKESWRRVPLSGRLAALAARQLQRAEEERAQRPGVLSERLLELRRLEHLRWSQDSANLTLFNPSLLPLPAAWRRHSDERWLASFRHMEFTGSRDWLCNANAVSSVIVLAVLDEQLQPTRPVELLTDEDLYPGNFSCQDPAKGRKGWGHGPTLDVALGPEDGRLLALDDGVFVVFDAARPQRHFGFCEGTTYFRMIAAEIAPDLAIHGHHFEIRMESEVDKGTAPLIGHKAFGHYEKNWSPFIYRNESGEHLMMQQSVDPHLVMSMDHQFIAGKEVYRSTSPAVQRWRAAQELEAQAAGLHLGSVHGGVSPLLWPEPLAGLEAPIYLSALHVVGQASYYDYRTFLFAFEAKPPFRVLRIGDKALPLESHFSVFRSHVAFATQLYRCDAAGAAVEGDYVALLYGTGDAQSRQLKMHKQRLEEFL